MTDTHHTDLDLVYRGRYLAGDAVVTVESTDGRVRHRLRPVTRHSPTGLHWGYTGPGPLDCARSILADVLGDDAICRTCDGTGAVVYVPATDQYRPADPCRATGEAPELLSVCWDCDDGYRPMPYRLFTTAHVARFGPEWQMRRDEVLTWLHHIEQHATTRTG